MLRQSLLNGQPLVRDKDGIGFHPALPDFDESTKCADFFAALGTELKGGMAENEMDSDAYEAMTENGLTDACDNYNAGPPCALRDKAGASLQSSTLKMGLHAGGCATSPLCQSARKARKAGKVAASASITLLSKCWQ